MLIAAISVGGQKNASSSLLPRYDDKCKVQVFNDLTVIFDNWSCAKLIEDIP